MRLWQTCRDGLKPPAERGAADLVEHHSSHPFVQGAIGRGCFIRFILKTFPEIVEGDWLKDSHRSIPLEESKVRHSRFPEFEGLFGDSGELIRATGAQRWRPRSRLSAKIMRSD